MSLFKLKRQTKPRKEKNESSTKSLTKKKKKISPLAHSSAHSYPNIGKAPNLLFNIFQIQKQKTKTKLSYNHFVIFVCMHECRFLGFRLLLLLQLIPMATISISLCFCYYVLSFFFIASYVLGEDIVKLRAKCVVKKKSSFLCAVQHLKNVAEGELMFVYLFIIYYYVIYKNGSLLA